MIFIIDPQTPFLSDEGGKREDYNQRYFRLLWSQRPPKQKEIHAFYNYTKREENKGNLKYKVPKTATTFYNWYHRFEWESWWEEELSKNINSRVKRNLTDTHFDLLEASEESVLWIKDILNIARVNITKDINAEWTEDNDLSEKMKLMSLLMSYKDLQKYLDGTATDHNEAFNILKSIINSDDNQDELSRLGEMLKESEALLEEDKDD